MGLSGSAENLQHKAKEREEFFHRLDPWALGPHCGSRDRADIWRLAPVTLGGQRFQFAGKAMSHTAEDKAEYLRLLALTKNRSRVGSGLGLVGIAIRKWTYQLGIFTGADICTNRGQSQRQRPREDGINHVAVANPHCLGV